MFCICYENVDNIVLWDCCHYCWAELTQPQSLFCSSSHPSSEAAQEVMREKSWGSWPSWPKGYSRSYDVMLRIWIWERRRKGRRGTFGVMVFFCLSHCYVWWISVFPDIAEHWPADGNYFINSLFCLHVQLFLYILNCSYLNPQVFSFLLFWFSSPSHCRCWVSHSVVASYWVGLNHDIVGNKRNKNCEAYRRWKN